MSTQLLRTGLRECVWQREGGKETKCGCFCEGHKWERMLQETKSIYQKFYYIELSSPKLAKLLSQVKPEGWQRGFYRTRKDQCSSFTAIWWENSVTWGRVNPLLYSDPQIPNKAFYPHYDGKSTFLNLPIPCLSHPRVLSQKHSENSFVKHLGTVWPTYCSVYSISTGSILMLIGWFMDQQYWHYLTAWAKF